MKLDVKAKSFFLPRSRAERIDAGFSIVFGDGEPSDAARVVHNEIAFPNVLDVSVIAVDMAVGHFLRGPDLRIVRVKTIPLIHPPSSNGEGVRL